jgi:thioredoxin reductase (NADPH)
VNEPGVATENNGPGRAGWDAPVLLVVDADPEDLQATAAALTRRFSPDYRVLTAGSAAAGRAELERLAGDGDEVALVAAALHLPDDDGLAFLERAAARHRGIAGRSPTTSPHCPSLPSGC